jgi:CDP-diacylglycerol--glycerol-3-phosphate 3-phosphatidyltransferase
MGRACSPNGAGWRGWILASRKHKAISSFFFSQAHCCAPRAWAPPEEYWRFKKTPYNKITIVRILLIPVFVTLAIYYGQSIKRGDPVEWERFAAIVVFLVAGVSDGLDGYIARHYNQRSALGVILDPIADKGLLLSGIITLSISNWNVVDPGYGRFPIWFPVLVITRDVVLVVGSTVLHLLNGKVQVRPKWTGKVATFFQICAIAWVMLQLHFLPLLLIISLAGLFTSVSGVQYVLEGVRQLQAEGHAHARAD